MPVSSESATNTYRFLSCFHQILIKLTLKICMNILKILHCFGNYFLEFRKIKSEKLPLLYDQNN